MSTVAVVGNASYLFDRRYGSEINSHDQVARINRAAILFTKPFEFVSHGDRTDMWFMWRHKEYETANFAKPPFVMQMAYWEKLDDESVNLYSSERQDKLQSELGAVPSTGLMVLDYLSSLNEVDLISVYGYDWKATPTFTDPNRETDKMLNSGDSLHDFYREREYCFTHFIPNPRFRFRF